MSTCSIFVNCRNSARKTKKRSEYQKYGIQNYQFFVNYDYYAFLNNIIRNCQTDFALVCHDDVYFPLDIRQKIDLCITRANKRFGPANWGMVGNAGIEFFTYQVVRFLNDPHPDFIAYDSQKPVPVVHVDGNTLLLNIKNLRTAGVELPEEFSGFHFYDLILTFQIYLKNLVCAVDSSLFVRHNSGGNQKEFDKYKDMNFLRDYLVKHFINHIFKTLNGDFEISPDLAYLQPGSNSRIDLYEHISRVLINTTPKQPKKKIRVVIRTRLRNLRILKRLLNSVRASAAVAENGSELSAVLSVNNASSESRIACRQILKDYRDLEILWVEEKKTANPSQRFPRVQAIQTALNALPEIPHQFVWIVDEDDFIFPTAMRHLSLFLDEQFLFIGDSQVFLETWNSHSTDLVPKKIVPQKYFQGKNYHDILRGDNLIPICSVIYPLHILKKIFAEQQLLGDYYEDYALLLLAQRQLQVKYYPLLLAGVSYHGKNTVLERDRTNWDYSYATFLSEIVNQGTICKTFYDCCVGQRPSTQHESTRTNDSTIYEKRLQPFIQKWQKSKKRIVIFGIGPHTDYLFTQVPDLEKVNLVGYIDNNKTKHGKNYRGKKVHPINWAEKHSDVVICSSYVNELQMAAAIETLHCKIITSHTPLCVG